MPVLLFILILLAFYHLYFQNIIRNLFVSFEQSKLYDLELRLEGFRERRTISTPMYIAFKVLFTYSQNLLLSEEGIETYIALNRSPKPAPSDNSLQALFAKNKNFDVADLYKDWEKIMKDAVHINYYAWSIYLLPLIIYGNMKKAIKGKQNRYFDIWLSNITVPPEYYQALG